MTETNKTVLNAILDGMEVTDEQRKGVFRALEQAPSPAPDPVGRLYTAGEVAKLVHRTTKAVRAWAARGYLVPIKLPGMQRARGYTEASVRALLEGRAPVGGVVAALE